jgi:hypothetical protein
LRKKCCEEHFQKERKEVKRGRRIWARHVALMRDVRTFINKIF